MAATAESHGHEATYTNRPTRLQAHGVGAGAAPSENVVGMPIAVKGEDGAKATLDKFRANVVEGSGADLPAILGFNSMQEKDAVIILRRGKEQMVIPGPGGYKIERSPGTITLPVAAAPSGHLVIPSDHFAGAIRPPEDQMLSFVADHTTE